MVLSIWDRMSDNIQSVHWIPTVSETLGSIVKMVKLSLTCQVLTLFSKTSSAPFQLKVPKKITGLFYVLP